MTTTSTHVHPSGPGTGLLEPPALPWTRAPRLERDELARTAARLVLAHPDAGPGTVLAVLVRTYRRFDRCRVRTYVPVLVERAARDELDRDQGRGAGAVRAR